MSNKSPILVLEVMQQPQGRGSVLYIYERAGVSLQPEVLPRIRACLKNQGLYGDLRASYPSDADTIRILQNIVEDCHRSNGRIICSDDQVYETSRGLWKITLFLPKIAGNENDQAAL